jgi:hypothetical protein
LPACDAVSADVQGEPLVSEAPNVRALLQQSRAANLARLRAGNSRPPNYQQADAHAAQALELREAAHAADPEHADPEWANDRVSHDETIAFLRLYPLIP